MYEFKSTDYLSFFRRIFVKIGLPIQLIYFITMRCNSNCKYCFLKDRLNKEEKILNLEEIERVSLGIPLLASLSLTGGEPFLRPDIAEIARIFYRNSNVKNIVIATNGYLTENILSATERICKECDRATVFLGISLDGIGSSHDKIRRLNNSFVKAIDTFRGLKRLKKDCRNLNVSINMTFSLYNQSEIMKLYCYVRDDLSPDNIEINFARGTSWEDTGIGKLDIEKYREVTSLKENDYIQGRIRYKNSPFVGYLAIAKEFIQYRLIAKIYNEQRPVVRCFAGWLLAIMSSEGDIFACEMLPEKIGNIRDFDYRFDKLWFSKNAQKIRKFISQKRCFCTYECAMTGNILFNPCYYVQILKELLKKGKTRMEGVYEK